MGTRFIPPPNQINKIAPKKSKRSYSDQSRQSMFHEFKKNVREAFTADAFAQVGSLNAIVLEVIESPIEKMNWRNPLMKYLASEQEKMPDYYEVRFRIPELHAHLPEPENDQDWAAINRHPKALMTKDKPKPNVGDIVVIDFQDKNNFTGAIVTATINTSTPPSGGSNCSTGNVFSKGTPTLNVAEPIGETVETTSGSLDVQNDISKESIEDGIIYPSNITANVKKAIYVVPIEDLIESDVFNNPENLNDILYSKEVFSICFTVVDGKRYAYSKARMKKITDILKDKGYDFGFLVKQESEDFNTSYSILANNMIKQHSPNYVVFEMTTETQFDVIEKINKAIQNILESFKIPSYILMTDSTEKHFEPNEFFGLSMSELVQSGFDDSKLLTKVFYTDNKFDYNLKKQGKRTKYEDAQSSNKRKSYYLDGINFLKTQQDKCFYGERTAKVLDNEINMSNNSIVMFLNYNKLEFEILDVVKSKMNLDPEEKQKFLNSTQQIKKREKAKVENTSGNVEDIAPVENTPSLNSVTDQDPTVASPIENKSSPGIQCSPVSNGFGANTDFDFASFPSSYGAAGDSMRFDQIENYQNLGWTTAAGNMVNAVIIDYMNKLTAAVYAKLPLNHIAFTGSDPKKIRLTSTARTPAKQVELMWDKIKVKGDNAIWSLYGRHDWVVKIVNAYYANDVAGAIAVVQGRIDRGEVTGHLAGKGVDIHTYSHIRAEGLPHSNISIAQMNKSAFIQAVVQSAKECNSKPVVEDYQQHIHITIY